jgi:hypothetical protein
MRKGCGLSLLRNKMPERTLKEELRRKGEDRRKWKRSFRETQTIKKVKLPL